MKKILLTLLMTIGLPLFAQAYYEITTGGNNVGIFTVNPTQALDVQGTVNVSGNVISNNKTPALTTDPVKYLGLVGTRAIVPNALSSSSSDPEVMSRSFSVATTSITSLAIEIPNWYVTPFVNTSTPETETNSGQPMTVTAGIEYPTGTFTQVTFGGSTSSSIAAGSNVVSDFINVTIPQGAGFWIRIYAVSTGGIPFHNGNNGSGNGSGNIGGTSVTDTTVTGGVVNPSNGFIAPIAIIGYTSQPSLLILGDSRCEGQGDLTNDTTGDYGNITKSFQGNYGYIQECNGGDQGQWWLASHANRVLLAKYVTHVINAYGYNDWSNGQNQATLTANMVAINKMFHATNKVYNITLGPLTTSSDSFATLGNQTIPSAPREAIRVSYNDLLRLQNNTYSDGFFDISSIDESAIDSGKWAVTGVANFYTADGAHETANMNLLIKSSGVIPAIVASTAFSFNSISVGSANQFEINSSGLISTNVGVGTAQSTNNLTTTGNIGIGTTAAHNSLVVEGTSTSPTIQIGDIGGTGSFPLGYLNANDTTNTINLGSRWNNAMNFQINGASKETIDINGNLGIGTTGPSSLLAVGTTSQFRINSSGIITTSTQIGQSASPSILTVDGNVGIGTNISNILTVTGNVAVGTLAAPNQLVIEGTTTSPQITLGDIGGSGSFPLAYFNANDSTNSVNIGSRWAFPINFQMQALNKMTIDTNGNVGIGSITPGQILDVQGTIRVGKNFGLKMYDSGGTSWTCTPAVTTGVFTCTNP